MTGRATASDQAAAASLNYLNVIINWPGLLKNDRE